MKLLCKIVLFLVAINGFSQPVNIDKALEQAGNNIGNSLQNDATIAILSFSTFAEELSNYIINGLTTSVLQTENLRVVSRQKISQILSELNFQMSGYVNDETAQHIGHMIGAQTVITGSMTRIDNLYRLNIQCLAVETAIIQKSLDFDIQRDRKIRSFESNEPGKPIKPVNFNFDSINLFENYSPLTTLTMIGFTYSPHTPIGFTVGGFGFYTSWNFAIPNWQGYEHDTYYKYDGDGKVNMGYSSEYTRYIDRNSRTYEIIDWTVGYNLNIIPRFLYFSSPFLRVFYNNFQKKLHITFRLYMTFLQPI
jgi:TolB-like protein